MLVDLNLIQILYFPVTVGVIHVPVETTKELTTVSPSYAYTLWVERFTSIQRAPPLPFPLATTGPFVGAIYSLVGVSAKISIAITPGASGVSVGTMSARPFGAKVDASSTAGGVAGSSVDWDAKALTSMGVTLGL